MAKQSPTKMEAGAVAAVKPLPEVLSFGVVKHTGQWHAVALRTRGTAVVAVKIIGSSDWLESVMDEVELAFKSFALHGLDPFEKEEE